MARDDVEFTVGVNNDNLTDGLDEARDEIRDFAEDAQSELSDIGGGLEEQVGMLGRLGTSWTRLLGIVTAVGGAAYAFYNWVLESERATSGLNRALEETERIEKRIADQQKERAKKAVEEADPGFLKSVEGDVKTLEEELKKARERLSKAAQFEIDFGLAAEPMRQLANFYAMIDEDANQFMQPIAEIQAEVNALQDEYLAKTKTVADLEESITETKEKQLKTDVDNAKRVGQARQQYNERNAKREQKAREERDRKEDEFLDEQVRRAEKIARTREQYEKRLERMAERRAEIERERRQPLGGFDQGLESIGKRIADAASKPNPYQIRLEKINSRIEKNTEDMAKALAKLPKPGMGP